MKSKTKVSIIVYVALVAAILVLLACVVMYGRKYEDVFFPHTFINGVDCSDLTVEEAEAQIKERVEAYELTIKFQDDDDVTLVGNSFRYVYVPDGSVQRYKDAQNWTSWITEANKTHSYTLESPIDYDHNALETAVRALPELQKSAMVAPADAAVVYKDGNFVVEEATMGSTMDPNAIVEAVFAAADATDPELNVDEQGLYIRPTVFADEPILSAQAEQLSQIANANITLTLVDETTRSITPELLRSWMKQDEEGNYYRDDASYEEELHNFVKEVKTATEPKDDGMLFDTTLDGTITVPFGQYSTFYGYELDEATEYSELYSEIENHVTITREPHYNSEGVGMGNHGIGKTYAEVNLTRQYMWFYQDGNLVFETNIVSGQMTTWRYTPGGVYKLGKKESPHTMKGEVNPATDEPIYTVTCTYWMPIIPSLGIGFHDYDYRGDWSSSAYWYDGSHGCINMHGYDAAVLYDLIKEGTPVIMYYTEEYGLDYEMSPYQKFIANGGVKDKDKDDDDEDEDEENGGHSVAETVDEEGGESSDSGDSGESAESSDSGGDSDSGDSE